MKKILVVIAMLLGAAAFADEMMTFDKFDCMVQIQTGKIAYEYYGDNYFEAYKYYAENPQCLILTQETNDEAN